MASSKSKTQVLGCPLFQISSHEKKIPFLPQAAGPDTLSNISFTITSSALTQWLSRAHKSCSYLYNLLRGYESEKYNYMEMMEGKVLLKPDYL